MSESLEVEVEKLVPVSLPLNVVAWLQKKADELQKKHHARVGVGTVAKAIILRAYKAEKVKETGIKNVFESASEKDKKGSEKLSVL